MKLLAGYLICLFFVGLAGMALADADDNSILQGTYNISENVYCVNAFGSDGFSNDLTLINGGLTISTTIQGVMSFAGEGAGSSSGNWININNSRINPGDRPVNYGTFESSFTYVVNMDKTLEISDMVSIIENAIYPGFLTTIESGDTITGSLANGNKTFILTDINPSVEIVTNPDGSSWERVCSRTITGIKTQ